MQVAMFRKPVVVNGQPIPPWKPHLFYSSQMRKIVDSGLDKRDIIITEVNELPWWDGERPVNNMLVFGGGGFGDKVQSTCAFRKLAAKIGRPIDLAVDAFEAYENLPYIANMMQWAVPLEIIQNYDAMCSFEDVLGNDNERTTHLAELFAERCFVNPLVPGESKDDPGEYRCDWVFAPDEHRTMVYPQKDPGQLWVAIQVASNGFSRSWPFESVLRVSEMLVNCGHPKFTVFLIGSAGQGPHWATPVCEMRHELPAPPDGIVNLCGYFPDWRHLAMFLEVCDLVIAPDSGPLHLAGVLAVPSIGLYGPHTYETRGRYFPTQHPIMVSSSDSRCPCHCHSDQQHGTIPCGQKFCSLMAAITPEVVYGEVFKLIDEAVKRPPDTDGDGDGVPADLHGIGQGECGAHGCPDAERSAVPCGADGC